MKHARLRPSVSVSLIKDDVTGVLNWRYRFLVVSKNGTYRKHDLKDYPYDEFNSLVEFKSRIEYQRELEKTAIENAI